VPLTPDLTLKSLTVALGHGLSFWDGLIWAAAHQHQVSTIYTEDFQHDRVVEGVRFVAFSGIPTQVKYYRPKVYGGDLSLGVRSIQAIPGFEGDIGPAGETILGVILGFEGYKSLHAWERVGPSRVVAFVGDPPYEPELLERSRESNREFLERISGVSQGPLHTHDVFKAKIQLQDAYDNLRSKGDISFVSPLLHRRLFAGLGAGAGQY
jgi:hypothetical protein